MGKKKKQQNRDKGFKNWKHENLKQRFGDFGHLFLDIVNIGLLFVGGEEIVGSEYAARAIASASRYLSTDLKVISSSTADRISKRMMTSEPTKLHKLFFTSPDKFTDKIYPTYEEYMSMSKYKSFFKYIPTTQLKSISDFMRYKKSFFDIVEYPFLDSSKPMESLDDFYINTVLPFYEDRDTQRLYNEEVLQYEGLYRLQKLAQAGITATVTHYKEIFAQDEVLNTYDIFDRWLAEAYDPDTDDPKSQYDIIIKSKENLIKSDLDDDKSEVYKKTEFSAKFFYSNFGTNKMDIPSFQLRSVAARALLKAGSIQEDYVKKAIEDYYKDILPKFMKKEKINGMM